MSFFYIICVVYLHSGSTAGKLTGRVRFGQFATENQFPYYVGLYRQLNSNKLGGLCGGAIIDQHTVLTAAHCLTTDAGTLIPSKNFFVIAGTISKSDRPPLGQYPSKGEAFETAVKSIWIHPKYVPPGLDYDLAFMKLTSALPLHLDNFASIPMNTQPRVPPGTNCTVCGFGLDEFASFPDVLKFANVHIMDWDECRRKLSTKNAQLPDTMMCAIGNEKQNSGLGDSGGPLVCNGKLVGVVSHVVEGLENDYGIYARVSVVGHIDPNTIIGRSSSDRCAVQSGGATMLLVPLAVLLLNT